MASKNPGRSPAYEETKVLPLYRSEKTHVRSFEVTPIPGPEPVPAKPAEPIRQGRPVARPHLRAAVLPAGVRPHLCAARSDRRAPDLLRLRQGPAEEAGGLRILPGAQQLRADLHLPPRHP